MGVQLPPRAPTPGRSPGDRVGPRDASAPEPESPWDPALDRAAALLRAVAERHGPKGLAAIVSARLTIEDLYVAKRVLGDLLGVPRLAVPPHEAGEDDHLLLITAHHIAIDGWSRGVLQRELSALYDAARRGTSPRPLRPPASPPEP